MSFTLRWLRARVPTTVDRTVLVQGDTGPGNFMYRDGEIVAVVDWELAHLGDPLEDLACGDHPLTAAALRAARPVVPPVHRALGASRSTTRACTGGRVFNVVRCVIGEGVVTASGEANPERGMIYGLLQMHRRVTVDALARAAGSDVRARGAAVDDADAGAPTERTRLYDLVADTIDGALLPAIDDPMVTHQGRAMVRLVRHLALVDRFGPQVDAQARARDRRHPRRRVRHRRRRAYRCSIAAIDTGALDGPTNTNALVQYFRNETTRQAPLVQPMLGRLATVELADWRD